MRLHLTLALIVVLLLVITLRPSERHRFTFAQVQASAQQLAQKPYVPLPDTLPPQLRKLTPAQELGIFWNDKYRLWRKYGLPFQVDFYHLSNEGRTSPKINMVDSRRARALAFSPAFFNYRVPIDPPLPPNLGYAGFYVRYPINKPDSLDGFFSALGASYFRVVAKDQVYGLSARGLAINAGLDGKTEEFPEFKEWWLHEPDPNATELVLDALLDSASVTGAYEFKLRPGPVTSVDIHAVLFFRRTVDWIGIAPFSSMYLYGENAANHFGNFHPEIHDSDGVLVNTGKGDWLWRPLEQAPLFQIYRINDENPKGFGLLQRDRDFQHYQDLSLKYNVRPSAWITPHGNWGKGAVILAHRPSDNPNTDNVVLFWHPEQIPQAGDRMVLDYTIDFYMNDASRPPLAYSNATWVLNPAPPPAPPVGTSSALNAVKQTTPPPAPLPPSVPGSTTPVQFQIDFAGNGIEDIPADKPPYLYLHFDPPETRLRDSILQKIGYGNSWRATFTIIPFKHNVPTELQCRLMQVTQPQTNAKPLSEEWNYTWHQ
ncbi:MAG: glucan biosynthesis protein [Methylacidiphilales bacterium]|nr:glucan biosynthesis protein [Candidatus Methylacidiphilales bacterium]